MVKRINDTKYIITNDLKDRLDTIVNNMTKNKGIFSPISDKVLINTILPRVVTDMVYEYIKRSNKTINITVTYRGKEYIVTVANNQKLKGFIYNVIDI